jgi:hypothetical protein
MADFDRILGVKKAAQRRLLAIPGVHSVAIGAKVVAGKRTSEPSIAVFVGKKKKLSDLSSSEVIPTQIEGIKTDVIEEESPELFAGTLPDQETYSVMDGGIQIQAGTKVAGFGTLGFIASTNDPDPKIVAVTCQHVVAHRSGQSGDLKLWISPDEHRIILYGTNATGIRVRVLVSLQPNGGTSQTLGPFDYVTAATDTPVSIASNLAGQINALANPNVTVAASTTNTITGPGGDLRLTPGAGFNATLSSVCQVLWANQSGTKVVTFAGNNPGGLLVSIQIVIVPNSGDLKYLDVFYTTLPGDSLNAVAAAVAGVINGLADPGDVTAAGPSLPTGSEITITSGANGVAAIFSASVYVSVLSDPASTLKATIANPTGPGANSVITLSGQVTGENYGIYANVNPGGQSPSYGIFFQPVPNSQLSDIAAGIAGALASQNISNLTATPAGPQITITGAEEVESVISPDVRVGQPVNSFASACSKCCDKQIGHVLKASLLLDTALIELEAGVQYKAEIEEIGVVAGDYSVTDNDIALTYPVKKRGRTTGLTTNGNIDYLHADGEVGQNVFHRRYTDAMKITATGSRFSDRGDSGSAVLNTSNQIVGVLFAGNGTVTYATPIQNITNLLDITVETASAPSQVHTVPAPAASAMAKLSAPALAVRARNVHRLGVNWERLREAEKELASVPAGHQIAAVVRRHIPEAQRLIHSNRRFAAVWQRYGGSQILQAILRMPQFRDQNLPSTINGRPLLDCLRKIEEALLRYASQELSRDLSRYRSLIQDSLQLSYSDLLVVLQSVRVE